MPLSILLSQGSEPYILRVDARIALAAATGDTTICTPIDAHLSEFTYFNGGRPGPEWALSR